MTSSFDKFIGRVRVLDKKIDHQLKRAEKLKSLSEQITTIWSDAWVQTSTENKRERRLADLIDSKRELERLLNQREQAADEIRDFLYSNLSEDNADVLEWKYCDDLSIFEIAEKECLSYSGAASKIYRAETKARAKYEERVKNDE